MIVLTQEKTIITSWHAVHVRERCRKHHQATYEIVFQFIGGSSYENIAADYVSKTTAIKVMEVFYQALCENYTSFEFPKDDEGKPTA